MTAGSNLLDRAAMMFSLAGIESGWSETLKGSLLLKPVFSLFDSVQRFLPPDLARIGTILQNLSFLVTVLLFGLIGLRQFANDKLGLAVVVFAGLGLWLVGRLLGGTERRKFNAFDAIVLLYLAANIVATFSSHYFQPSLKGLFKVCVYIGSYFLFTAVLAGSLKRKLTVLAMALACGCGLSLYGFYQYKIGVAPLATWEDPTVESTGTRIFATLDNPNLLAGLLVPLATIGVGLGLGFFSQFRSMGAGGTPVFSVGKIPIGKPQLLLLALAGLAAGGMISVATILTQSRGGYAGLAAGLGVILYIGCAYLWAHKRKLRPLVIAAALSLVCGSAAMVTFVPALNQRVQSMFAGSEHSSNAYRMKVYASSAKMFKDNWWIGTGPGNETFRQAYGLYMVSTFDALGTYCVPLEVAVEAGVPGLLAFLAMLSCALARTHLKFWNPEKSHNGGNMISRWLAATMAAALVGLMVHGLVDTVFYRPQVHFLFWLILAVIVTPDEPGTATAG